MWASTGLFTESNSRLAMRDTRLWLLETCFHTSFTFALFSLLQLPLHPDIRRHSSNRWIVKMQLSWSHLASLLGFCSANSSYAALQFSTTCPFSKNITELDESHESPTSNQGDIISSPRWIFSAWGWHELRIATYWWILNIIPPEIPCFAVPKGLLGYYLSK